MRFEVLECDWCHKQVPRQGALGWIGTHSEGINVTTLSEMPAEGLFDSVDCLLAYFMKKKGAG